MHLLDRPRLGIDGVEPAGAAADGVEEHGAVVQPDRLRGRGDGREAGVREAGRSSVSRRSSPLATS